MDDDVVGTSACEVRRRDGAAQTAGGAVGTAVGMSARVLTVPLRRVSGAVGHGHVAATWRRRADRQAQRGKQRLIGGSLMSAISELNLLPDENSSK
jgi:uncharacterized protein YwlG (UPF0340 family)